MTLSWFADADTHKLAQHRDYLSPRCVSCKHIMHQHVCVCVCVRACVFSRKGRLLLCGLSRKVSKLFRATRLLQTPTFFRLFTLVEFVNLLCTCHTGICGLRDRCEEQIRQMDLTCSPPRSFRGLSPCTRNSNSSGITYKKGKTCLQRCQRLSY